MNISIAGTGYVGLVTGTCLAEKGHNVVCVDVDQAKLDLLNNGHSPIFEADLEELLKKNIAAGRLKFMSDYHRAYEYADVIFIGVGTPERPDGSADLSYISNVCKQISESVKQDCLVVVKSTVPIGTNDKIERFLKDFKKNPVTIEVASNPEFLAQGSAVKDTLHASRIVIGTESENAENLLKKLYAPFNIPIISVSRRSAEMIKYASNNFLALKISYINDIANLCELIGADIEEVVSGMKEDPRIGSLFLNAGIGYGGSCFPKDTNALVHVANSLKYELKTISAAIEINKKQKTRLFEKAKERLLTMQGLKAAVLGLTFKPGTDDVREAPSLVNIPLLKEAGADIYVYDPVGTHNFQKKFPKYEITYCNSIDETLDGADICFIFTEWEEIKQITPDKFKKLMNVPLVFDGRNIWENLAMKQAGVEYYSIGR